MSRHNMLKLLNKKYSHFFNNSISIVIPQAGPNSHFSQVGLGRVVHVVLPLPFETRKIVSNRPLVHVTHTKQIWEGNTEV